MYRKSVLALALVLFCQSLAPPALGQAEITAVRLTVGAPVAEVNARPETLDVPAQILDGNAMVPLRFLGNAVGAVLDYDAATRTVLYQKGDRVAFLALDSSSATVNSQRQALDTPLRVVNGRTLVPLSFVRDGLGFDVRVGRDERSLTILHGTAPLQDDAADVDDRFRSVDQGQQVTIIKQSYQRALGRDPNQGELNFWLGVLRSYPWAANVDTLVRWHGQWLRSNAYTAAGDDVVRRAYQAVFRRQPNAVELRGAQDWIHRDGEIYETLVRRLERARPPRVLTVRGSFAPAQRQTLGIAQQACEFAFKVGEALLKQEGEKPRPDTSDQRTVAMLDPATAALIGSVVIVVAPAVVCPLLEDANAGRTEITDMELEEVGNKFRVRPGTIRTRHRFAVEMSSEWDDQVAVYVNNQFIRLTRSSPRFEAETGIAGPGQINVYVLNTAGKGFYEDWTGKWSVNVSFRVWVDGKEIGSGQWSGWEPKWANKHFGPYYYGPRF